MLFEFLACLVRIAFQRANPKFGQYDNKRELVPLPGCLERMLTDVLLPNAKQDMSSLFREEIAEDAEVQAVLAEYRPKLRKYYHEACKRDERSRASQDGNKLSMEAWRTSSRATSTSRRRRSPARPRQDVPVQVPVGRADDPRLGAHRRHAGLPRVGDHRRRAHARSRTRAG